MRKCARFAAVVGRREDLQCSVGAVNRLALYRRLWKLPMRPATVYLHNEEVHEETRNYVAFEWLRYRPDSENLRVKRDPTWTNG